MAALIHRQNEEKPIGCMSTFLHIFDHQQILARKRIHSSKRLPPSTSVGASSGDSPEFSQGLEKHQSSTAKNENVRKTSPAKDSTPSVIARLMGLERLTPSDQKPPSRSAKAPASRDQIHSKYIDGNNFQVKQPKPSKLESSRSFSHSADFFPEPNQPTVIMHGAFENRLKMKGMDEQINDLTALKQILEVLQLKGLLNSTCRSNRDGHRNIHSSESSLHLKQWRSLASKVAVHRSAVDRSSRIPARAPTSSSSPNRIECNLKSCNSIIKRKPLSIDIQRRSIASSNSLRDSPIQLELAKLKPKKTGSAHHSFPNRSMKASKVVTDDESSSISESILTNSEGCREGMWLLERCDKLLQSITEMNSDTESPPSSGAVLPSPVSVLDSGFDKDESWSPSHSIDFKATPTVDIDYENWSPKISPTNSTEHEEFFTSDDPDFIYVSQIIREYPDVFFSIEKHTSNDSIRHQKLVFDGIVELLDRNRELPPWIEYSRVSVKKIWFEFQKMREVITGDGFLELIIRKDVYETKDWGDYLVEMSEAILDVERLIFKDLVSEAIGELVEFSGECVLSRARRRLVF